MRLARIRTFLVVNPRAVFIVLFAAVVFAVSAYLLILEGPGYAIIDSVVVLAYCFLAVGIVLQAVGSIRAKALGERA